MHHVWWLLAGLVVGIVLDRYVWPRVAARTAVIVSNLKSKVTK